MNKKKTIDINKRISIIGFLKFTFLGILFSRLCFLQIFERKKFKTMSEKNSIKIAIGVPNRGKILDKNSFEIASNKTTKNIKIDCENKEEFLKTIDEISKILKLKDFQTKKIKHLGYKKTTLINQDLSWDQIVKLNKSSEISGISIVPNTKRYYPHSDSIAHVSGYTKEFDIQKSRTMNDTKAQKGIFGIEKKFDYELSGQFGSSKLEVNAKGQAIRILSTSPQTDGKNIRLSIDLKIQNKAYELLSKFKGAIVVIDLKNNNIAAMCSSPSFDPNKISSSLSMEEWEKISNNKSFPMLNRTTNYVFSPGSVFKPVVALAALENKIITEDLNISCNGSLKIGDRSFQCINKNIHGQVNLRSAIAKSCNVFFYNIAKLISPEEIYETAKILGLGKKYGILPDPENIGILPTKNWKYSRYSDKWRLGDTANYTIGQGFVSCTILQLAVMSGRIATGNTIDPSILIEQTNKLEKIEISKKNLNLIRLAMSDVMKIGTGLSASKKHNIDCIAGKTGTTQLISKKNSSMSHSVFIGFAPYDNPKYSIACIVEKGDYKNKKMAVDLSSQVIKYALSNE